MRDFKLVQNIEGYVTAYDPTNAPDNILISGSQNVLIDGRNGKVKMRKGYTRLGVANEAMTPIRNAFTWTNSSGVELPQRFYDDELEVYLGTVDTTVKNAWTRVANGWDTTEVLRSAIWWDATENIDLQLMVIGDDKIYEWGGGVAVASAISAATVTEAGDASNQLSLWSISGATSSNTNAFVLYWKLVDAAGTRTVSVYKNSDGAAGNLVAEGSRVGDGAITLAAQNASGLTGAVTVAYSGDDTTLAANTLTLTYSITKGGTDTFAQARFYTTRNKTLVNTRTGYEFTYTGGEDTTILTGVTPATNVDIVAGDVLIQKMVTHDNEPADGRNNDTIAVFENQLILGSFDDNEVYISKNSDFTDFAYSAPRVAGEGGLLTLDAPSSGLGSIGQNLICFAGKDSIFRARYQEIAVGNTLAETLVVKKLETGSNQGSISPDSIVSMGSSLAYVSNEPTVRVMDDPDSDSGTNLRIMSDPIKPDFDAEDFTGAMGLWFKNALYITSPVNSRMYILEIVGTPDGKVKRFWQPPQLLPVGAMTIIGGNLHGHSNANAESYKLFDGYSDINSNDDKLPIVAVATYSYRNYGNRDLLKNFDEFYVEGEISPSTEELNLTLNYNYGGYLGTITKVIDGTDEDILEESIEGVSLAQESLGVQPLGGSSTAPPTARKFRVIFEVPREDFNDIQPIFSCSGSDKYFSILACGPNVVVSTRKSINIKK